VKTAALLLLSSCALFAQSTTVAEMKTAYTAIKSNLTRMAEKMPADQYDFKPVNEIRGFGALMAHIADTQLRVCSVVNGEMKNPTAASKTAKDDLVAALKESFAECDKAWDGTTEANASQSVNMGGRGQMSRLGLLSRFIVAHGNEEYGYGAIYLRLKGIVPPSSDAPAGGAGKKQ
jgi:hypothetical protein